MTVLQDPSVATAPLEQRISFLRSKNLTQEEIDVSLARVGQGPAPQASGPPANYQSQYRQQPQQYGGYQQQPYWAQPPPEVPRRDWRDWFIMATMAGGVGYAMYWTAKRYVLPIISPPTAPQLEQDKASIDQSFDKAFALLDQLATDTQELKESEKLRSERLDQALADVESVVTKMKEANENRELETKRMAREIADIKEQIPRAIGKEKETTDGRLKDLATEMKSLKTLVGNRMSTPAPARPSFSSQTPAPVMNGVVGGSSTTASATTPAPASTPQTNGLTNGSNEDGKDVSNLLSERPSSTGPYGRVMTGKASIPSWQLSAKKRTDEAKSTASGTSTPQDLSQSGTAAEADA